MAAASEDTLTKVSTEAATEFVKTFYPALGSNRESLSSYYSLEPTTILFNGNRVTDGTAVQEIFTNQMSPTHYEVQSYDCQIINKAYPTILPGGGLKLQSEMGVKDMSFLIVVSGFVRYGEGRDQPQRGFSETFVLVPNPSAERTRGRKDWLIESQNFRLVV
ncbi:Nuclear transport factor 2 Eukaryote [Penicillium cf. griseofulvum]|uniref:Nuclear transport factor 2 Eukaryote n=1 Tax=Penicillium cf. griseofulvum TaxID=2972120 RepID=A0A9W9T2L9_9EURO|nr:Nuclear transport factor 2 Eukaryote [Penicillium cf. griseofulvum]KAJ5448024.1 Nuclear transport factor 2 Eukaryote [Penicillium cf. griseofulvum]